MRFRDQVQNWEAKIRSGLGHEVSLEVAALKHSEIPSQNRYEIANIARRVGLYRYALVLLREDFLNVRDYPLENEPLIAEYAATVAEVGAVRIAERLLHPFVNPKYAMTPFYRAMIDLKAWRYDQVPSHISVFHSLNQDTYRRQIADVNLVSAFITLKRYQEAETLLGHLKAQTDLPQMVKGIVSEQEGQLLFFTDSKEKARRHFAASLDLLRQANNSSAIYAEKWIRIIDLFEKPWQTVESEWNEFKTRVEKRAFSEVLRELDRYYAIRFDDESLKRKVYFGTPHLGYRQSFLEHVQWTPPTEFHYGSESKELDVHFRPATNELRIGGELTKMPLQLTQLLSALSEDLYRPAPVGSLFESIYEGDYFHPTFASQRILKAVTRLRNFFETRGIPLEIESTEMGFRLSLKPGFTIVYSDSKRSTDEWQARRGGLLTIIQNHFGENDFTAVQLGKVIGVPKRTVNRLLSAEIAAGKMISVGHGRGIRYRFRG